MGRYHRQPLRGFRKFAMVFWDAPRDGTIYGHLQMDVTRALQLQKDCQEKFGITPSMGQLMGKAIALAATKVPDINGKVIWGRVYLKDTVDVYFQVDVEDGKDLSGVVIPDTASKTIVEVAQILRDRANKLRGGQDKQYEKTQKGCLGRLVPVWALRGMLGALTFIEYNLGLPLTALGAQPEPFGTLMVTNVSKFGIDVAYAPLVPVSRVPFVCLVGQVKPTPWVGEDGQLCVRPVITGSATFDHRIVDGNKIGKFIRAVKAYMENPYAHEPGLGLVDPFPPAKAPEAPVGGTPPAGIPAGQTPPAGISVPKFKT